MEVFSVLELSSVCLLAFHVILFWSDGIKVHNVSGLFVCVCMSVRQKMWKRDKEREL